MKYMQEFIPQLIRNIIILYSDSCIQITIKKNKN